MDTVPLRLQGVSSGCNAILPYSSIVNQRTRNGWTPFNIIFHSPASEMPQGQAIHFLLQHGDDAKFPAPDNERYTPLLMAASTHGAEMLDLLFRHGAKVCTSEVTGETALHLMQDNLDLDRIRMLLRFGAGINAQGREGTTLLHKVVKTNPGYIRRGIVDFLLEVGADARTHDGCGRSARDWDAMKKGFGIGRMKANCRHA